MSDAPSLRIENPTVARGSHSVLHGVSLQIPPGAVTTLPVPTVQASRRSSWRWQAC
jgi:hypothetical protein